MLAKALGPRLKDVVVATKVGVRWDNDGVLSAAVSKRMKTSEPMRHDAPMPIRSRHPMFAVCTCLLLLGCGSSSDAPGTVVDGGAEVGRDAGSPVPDGGSSRLDAGSSERPDAQVEVQDAGPVDEADASTAEEPFDAGEEEIDAGTVGEEADAGMVEDAGTVGDAGFVVVPSSCNDDLDGGSPPPGCCIPETDAELCTPELVFESCATGATTANASVRDRCGVMRTLDCGRCGNMDCNPSTRRCICWGGGRPHSVVCGSLGCGYAEDRGACGQPVDYDCGCCGGGMTCSTTRPPAPLCPFARERGFCCTPEPDAEFCARDQVECGPWLAVGGDCQSEGMPIHCGACLPGLSCVQGKCL